jgi:hypothetical protein
MTGSRPGSFTNITGSADFTPTLSTTTQSSPYVYYFLCAYQVSVVAHAEGDARCYEKTRGEDSLEF